MKRVLTWAFYSDNDNDYILLQIESGKAEPDLVRFDLDLETVNNIMQHCHRWILRKAQMLDNIRPVKRNQR